MLDRGTTMAMPTEELLQQYFDDRLAMARLNFIQRIGQFIDANLTMHELRVVLLVASGIASSRERLGNLLNVSRDSLDATLTQLVHQGYIATKGSAAGGLLPTDEAMDIFDAVADSRDTTMELLASLDPNDLEALVRGTHALRGLMELQRIQDGGYVPAYGAEPTGT